MTQASHIAYNNPPNEALNTTLNDCNGLHTIVVDITLIIGSRIGIMMGAGASEWLNI